MRRLVASRFIRIKLFAILFLLLFFFFFFFCIIILDWNLYLHQVDMSKLKDRMVHYRNSGMKELNSI